LDLVTLVERAQRGDHDAFATLASGYIGRLDQTARLIVRDPELARDAVQDALFRAWRDLPRLRDPERFEAWLFRLATNACLDILRRRRRRAFEVAVDPIQQPSSEDLAGQHADREVLDQALRRLDPEWRAIVVLHYFVGLSVPDISAATGIAVGTVKSRLHRALGQMRLVVDLDEASGPVRAGGGHVA
jgi:RNA polymerase sigma-70 factor, ECF subfamily